MNRWMWRFGLVLIVVGVLTPVATWMGINGWFARLWSQEHAPNQGAMVLGGILFLGSLGLGVAMTVVGVVLALFGWMRDQ